ncbi:TadE/TadG family type IV pilus assembly protein [Plantibacter sp. T3]|uniref:TadE/TadG family type IV pilus assembly protein n=1 Tax=Plantibacter sp. T3 TaxID=2653161 RepID=UPI0012EF2F12|nr:TadE/TadG family type IV pilus assembly protein [Plantibacter sp. T3]VXB98550.1 TadE-like protein [Plantibacter sp. T3]
MSPASEPEIGGWRTRLLRGEDGSAVAEFVFVGAILTVLMMSVVQLALALHVRNTLIDAAAEGARLGALADTELLDGADRARQLIAVAVGEGYTGDVGATLADHRGASVVTVTVRAPLPVVGLIGLPGVLEVEGHAVLETLE